MESCTPGCARPLPGSAEPRRRLDGAPRRSRGRGWRAGSRGAARLEIGCGGGLGAGGEERRWREYGGGEIHMVRGMRRTRGLGEDGVGRLCGGKTLVPKISGPGQNQKGDWKNFWPRSNTSEAVLACTASSSTYVHEPSLGTCTRISSSSQREPCALSLTPIHRRHWPTYVGWINLLMTYSPSTPSAHRWVRWTPCRPR
jgi:hypothetical protein